MKVKELMEKLSALDPDMVVVLARDPEGNGFNELQDTNADMFFDGYNAYLQEDVKYLREEAGGHFPLERFTKVVVLWP